MKLHRILLGALLVALAGATPLLAQERLQEINEGDGRVHGAPVLQVVEAELHPGQVQTLNLSPGYHTVIEFPYPIAELHAGDQEIFLAHATGNKLTLKATKIEETETNVTVFLGDANLTAVPFLVRTDTAQAPTYIVRYTDPIAKHLNQAETQIAARLEADVDHRVAELAEQRLLQRLLAASPVVDVSKTEIVGSSGNKFGLTVMSAFRMPDKFGQQKVYVRYRVYNMTVAPLDDLYFIIRRHSTDTKWLVVSDTNTQELYDIVDYRTVKTIPAGTAAEGFLILEDLDLRDGESISVEAVGFNGKRQVEVERVLVGN